MEDDKETVHYKSAAGGWGSVRGMARIFGEELNRPSVLATLARQNKPGGFMCVSCAWTKPAEPLPFEFCENGAKATFWKRRRGGAPRSSSPTTPWPNCAPGATMRSTMSGG